MKKVIFATSFAVNQPDAENEMALLNTKTNTYFALTEAANISTYERVELLYQRDGELLSVPLFPSNMSCDVDDTLTTAAAQTVTIDLTGATSGGAAGDTYTLEIIHKGYPNDNRCRKYISAVYDTTYESTTDGITYSTSKVTSDDTLGAVLCAKINRLEMPYIAFTATYTAGDDTLVITVSSGYYSEELKVNGLDELDVLTATSGALSIVYSHTVGWTTAQIQALEADTDSMLGDHNYNYNKSDFFSLASGYTAACTSLLVIRTTKPDDDTLAQEPNFPQEIYLFYDEDVVVGTGTMASVIDWIRGSSNTLP